MTVCLWIVMVEFVGTVTQLSVQRMALEMFRRFCGDMEE